MVRPYLDTCPQTQTNPCQYHASPSPSGRSLDSHSSPPAESGKHTGERWTGKKQVNTKIRGVQVETGKYTGVRGQQVGKINE